MDAKQRLIALGLAGAFAIIPVYEGTLLKVYKDPVGIPTVCTGHTGPEVLIGDTWTRARCDEVLAQDIEEHNRVVDSCVTVPLNPNQRSAFVSFAFNVGPGSKGRKDGFCRLKSGAQPTFLRQLNAGQYAEACASLKAWNRAGGVVLKGLVLRREAEFNLCMKEYLPLLPQPSKPLEPPSEPTRKPFWQPLWALWERFTGRT